MALSVNEKTMLSLQLDQIAQQCYGNGFAEGKSGGNGYIGLLGGHAIKMYTHSDEYSNMDKVDTQIMDRVRRSCDALRTNLSNIANRYLDSNAVKAVRRMLGMDAEGAFVANRPLLSRKAVASALNTIEKSAHISLAWKGAASHTSKGFKTDYETLVRTTLQPSEGIVGKIALLSKDELAKSKDEHIKGYLKKHDSMAWSDAQLWPDIKPDDRIATGVTHGGKAKSTKSAEDKYLDKTSAFAQRNFTMTDISTILELDATHDEDYVVYDLDQGQFRCQDKNSISMQVGPEKKNVTLNRSVITRTHTGLLRSLGMKQMHDNLATFVLVRYANLHFQNQPPTVGQVKFLCELKEKLKSLENVLTPTKRSLQTTNHSGKAPKLVTEDLYELLFNAGQSSAFDQKILEAVDMSSSAEDMCDKIVTAYNVALRSLK